MSLMIYIKYYGSSFFAEKLVATVKKKPAFWKSYCDTWKL